MNMRRLALGTLSAVAFAGVFAVWAHVHPVSLKAWAVEDGVLENATALFFGLASIGFGVAMWRSEFLRARGHWAAYAFTGCWALLMFVFMGEEISWGQRIFGIETPEVIADANIQNELTLHNLTVLSHPSWGVYRQLSIMMLVTGLLLPIFASLAVGRRLIRTTCFPVCPAAYGGFFIAAYVFGRAYYGILGWYATEVREFVMSVAMLVFAGHGAFRPDDLFRAPPSGSIDSADA